jgi:hypothetical protein
MCTTTAPKLLEVPLNEKEILHSYRNLISSSRKIKILMHYKDYIYIFEIYQQLRATCTK